MRGRPACVFCGRRDARTKGLRQCDDLMAEPAPVLECPVCLGRLEVDFRERTMLDAAALRCGTCGADLGPLPYRETLVLSAGGALGRMRRVEAFGARLAATEDGDGGEGGSVE